MEKYLYIMIVFIETKFMQKKILEYNNVNLMIIIIQKKN